MTLSSLEFSQCILPVDTLENSASFFFLKLRVFLISCWRFADVPLYNATQNQIAEVVDFLAAHIEALIEVRHFDLQSSVWGN